MERSKQIYGITENAQVIIDIDAFGRQADVWLTNLARKSQQELEEDEQLWADFVESYEAYKAKPWHKKSWLITPEGFHFYESQRRAWRRATTGMWDEVLATFDSLYSAARLGHTCQVPLQFWRVMTLEDHTFYVQSHRSYLHLWN